MGAKTALLAFTQGDLRPVLLGTGAADRVKAEHLVREIHPGYAVTPIEDGVLGDWCYPPDDVTYVAMLPGAELLCDRRLILDRPSELPEELLRAGAGRRIIVHGMHSVSDWLCFAVWEDGVLVRSLSLSPDGGIVENIGEPYDFERPYWAGGHPVGSTLTGSPYPLPFHPLELGEDALRALFGFILEGRREPDDVDPFDVPVHGFRVEDPTGEEQAAREAQFVAWMEAAGPPRTVRWGSVQGQ
ncbi:DUF6928 family protein [Winogradskya humida]|uniref:Uncharacterized protein n=1 Tax=Winogradskya humida TaxID=113566 RepID=A0ABQ3ZXM6_9ACTN|nr:hypothetical protein [Actinoplanes humidus]GIE23370.1 hypothetical protein Ahu01nite_064720 [Actinoplanes humidus]